MVRIQLDVRIPQLPRFSPVRWRVQRKPRFSCRFKRTLYVFHTQSNDWRYAVALPRHRPCGQCTLMHMGLCPSPPLPFFHAPLTHTELQGNARVSATAKGFEKMREGERQRTNERFAFVRLSRATATAANRRKVALLRDHKMGYARACLCEDVGQ